MVDLVANRSKGQWLTRALIILALGVFAVGGVVSGVVKSRGNSGTIIKVGGISVSKGDFDRLYQHEAEYVRQMTGGNVSDADMAKMGLKANVLRALEDQALSLSLVSDLGLRIGNSAIHENIRENPVFFGEGDSFDERKFSEVLRGNGYTEQAYMKRLRDAMVQNSLMNTIGKQDLPINYATQALYSYRFQSRLVDVVKFDVKQASLQAKFSDSEVAKYYEQNQVYYYSPEARKVRYVAIGNDDVSDFPQITPEELQSAVNSTLEAEQERRSIANVIFAKYEDARNFINSLTKEDGTYRAIDSNHVKRFNVSEMSALSRSDLPNDFANAVFSLERLGDITAEPVPSPFGWHVAQLRKIYAYTAEDITEKVSKTLQEEKKTESLYALISSIEDEQGKGGLLQSIAQKHKLKVHETGFFSIDKSNGAFSGDFPKDAPLAMVNAAFAKSEGNKSDFLYDETSKKYYIFEVAEVHNGALKPLKEVKGEIINNLTRAQGTEKLFKVAQTLKDLISGVCHDKVAAATLGQGGVYVPAVRFYRTSVVAKLDMMASDYPDELIDQVFSLKNSGDVTGIVTDENGAVMFAMLREVSSAPDTGNDFYLSSVRGELNNAYRESLYRASMDHLRSRYKIKRSVDSVLE